MDARQAVKQAVLKLRLVSEGGERSVEAGKDDEPGEVGEIEVAEYVIFLLAFDTYVRYAEEGTGQENPETDAVIQRGLALMRKVDQDLDSIKRFIEDNLPSVSQKKMAARAFRMPARKTSGVSRRALNIRTALNLGGAATMRAVFQTNKNLRRIREGMSASMMDEASDALKVFAGFPIKNQRIRYWVRMAAKTAGLGFLPKGSVETASEEVGSDHKESILRENVDLIASSSAEETQVAGERQTERLAQIEADASAAAREALEMAGEADEPMTRSEVVGVATAAAVAAATDPSDPQNIPSALRRLDDEQRAAALTDGRVLVAAGAGAGKSTTLVARIDYLVNERRVLPTRILATSFNAKAASELKEKIGKNAGEDALRQMSVGTMHSLFGRYIREYGNASEREAMGKKGFVQTGAVVATAVQKLWAECFDSDDRPTPKKKNMLRYKSQWSGNNITPAMARANAASDEERDAAEWYEMYEGLKGAIPGWQPPCEEKSREVAEEEYQEKLDKWRRMGENPRYKPKRRGTTFETFMAKHRLDGGRLGDFDDMLSIFRDVLKREPAVRKAIQKSLDHIMVDECQDLNEVQSDIVMMMSEHVGDGSDGKSLWMVGDDKQSIYGFRGARPDLFTGLHDKEGWKTRMIKTNYRCEPEIVEAANKLIAHNEGQIPMEARPNPGRTRGMGSIRMDTAQDEAEAAINVVEEIKGNLELPGADVSENAVLCRTNNELHAYEAACIVRGVPYARKGASSFLGSPETSAMLGYVQLIRGDDYAKMQKALGAVLNNPNRFWLSPKDTPEMVSGAISQYARHLGEDINDVNPVAALRDPTFVEMLAGEIRKRKPRMNIRAVMGDLNELSETLDELQANSDQEGYTTQDMFNDILSLRGKGMAVDPATGRTQFVEQTFRETVQTQLRDATGDDDDAAEDEDDDGKGLGNISFLFELAKVDPTDPEDAVNDPGTPLGFKLKMERMAQRVRDLRIDSKKWDEQQQALPPDQRRKPPGVYLGTVHSVKGAQWDNTYVQMPKGKFPFEPPVKPGEPPPDPETVKAEVESERRLAYVALTRAAKALRVVCPAKVGGKPAGVSPFVDEAELTIGENVPKVGVEAEVELAQEMNDKQAHIAEDVDYDDPIPGDDEETPWED